MLFRSTLYWVGILAIQLIAFVGLPLFVKNRCNKLQKNNDFWVNDQKYVVNGKGLSLVSQHGDRRLEWREFRRIFETNEAMVFVVHKFHMVVLPTKEMTQDEKANLRQIVARNTQATRLKPKFLDTRYEGGNGNV